MATSRNFIPLQRPSGEMADAALLALVQALARMVAREFAEGRAEDQSPTGPKVHA
jgi:hypothetical protein